MKNLLWLVHGGLGERDKPGAPTFWKTIESYIADGWRVFVVDIGTKDDTPLGERDYGDGLYIIRFNPPFLQASNLRKIGRVFGFLQQLRIRRKLLTEAEKIIRAQHLTKSDTIVYGLNDSAVFPAKKISEKYGMKLVTRFYGIWDMYPLPYTLRNRFTHFPRFEALSTPADLIIMTNDGTNGDKMLRRMHNESPYVFWRNGVDIAPQKETELPFFSQLPAESKILMTLSRLHPGKRIDRAIRALPAVLEKYPETCLVICGYGNEKEALETLAAELHVADKVYFAGRVDHEDIFNYLRKADVFLSFYEASNLGNPLYEAMRCSLPIVTLDVGNTASVIENDKNGILLPPDQPELIPEAICRLLADPEERKRLGDAAGAFARENFWTWDERAAAEVRAVDALLEK